MIEDFLLRFTWTITVSIGQLDLVHGDILLSLLAPLEVFRYVLDQSVTFFIRVSQFIKVKNMRIEIAAADYLPTKEKKRDGQLSHRKNQGMNIEEKDKGG